MAKEKSGTTKKNEAELESLVGKYVLVGTDKQVLAAGTLKAYDPVAKTATLAPARQIVYFPSESKGAFGVAATGVPSGGRVSPQAPRAELVGVTGVLEATEAAKAAIEAGPWRA